jgi:hypothetical protein
MFFQISLFSIRVIRAVYYGIRPNMAVKGTRRTQAFLKVCCLFEFAGCALVCQPARPLLLRYVSWRNSYEKEMYGL